MPGSSIENVKLSRLYVDSGDEPPTLQREPRLLTPGKLSVVSDRVGRAGQPSIGRRTARRSYFRTRARRAPTIGHSDDLSLVEVASGDDAAAGSHRGCRIVAALFARRPIDRLSSPATIRRPGPGREPSRSSPASGGSRSSLADTHDGFGRYSEMVGWSADGKQLYFTEVQGTSLKLLALAAATVRPIEISRDERHVAGRHLV